ncbi:hypothetical protein CYMTET_33408 [Cymbomonas tetramitiformis]|uniref:Uncharacterized protein n=1 Tax=Cymbomonas tetramitiformis TaxID=36881 RepID=A0AAE0KQZ9_9CHLO|nr:hypothetical protein CYMTET_33408 [Cymbomonas tetramitiformis]
MDWLMDEKERPTFEEVGERVYTAHITFKGVFALLSDWYTMIQLKASMESDVSVHGGADALRAKLASIEEKVYSGTDGLVTDSVLTKWLKEFRHSESESCDEHTRQGQHQDVLEDAGTRSTSRGQGSLTELAVQMQGATLDSKTVGNYRPKVQAFMKFCMAEGRQWLPALEATVQAVDDAGEEQTVRTWLPARTHISITGDTVSAVLHKEKGGRRVHLKQRLTIPAAGVQGLVRLLLHWEQVRDASWVQRPAAGSKEQGSY